MSENPVLQSSRASEGAAVGRAPRVLVLCQMFYPELISTGQVLTSLCEELRELGADVEVVCGPPTIVDQQSEIPRDIEHLGIRIHRVWSTRFSKLTFWGKLANQLSFAISVFGELLRRDGGRPILVLTEPPFLAALCVALKWWRGDPFVYLIFDLYPDVAVATGHLRANGFVATLWNAVNALIFRTADRTLVIGRCMRDLVEPRLPSELRDRVRLVNLWADDSNLEPVAAKDATFVERWRLEGKFVLQYSGNMGRFHDLETILEGARRLKDDPRFVFLFIGEGFKKASAVEFAKRHELANCRFDTYVPRDELGRSLSVADVGLVSLSPGQEGHSVPSKTYGILAAGKPVIAVMSGTSEIARMVDEEGCGVVVTPGDVDRFVDTIRRLADRPDELAAMRRDARRAIEQTYSLHRTAARFLAIIEELQ